MNNQICLIKFFPKNRANLENLRKILYEITFSSLYAKCHYIRHFEDVMGFYIEFKDNIKCTLQDVITQKFHFKGNDLKTITYRILKCLNEIHEDRFLYLSLKPSNICFTNKGDMFLRGFKYTSKENQNHNFFMKKKNFCFVDPSIFEHEALD